MLFRRGLVLSTPPRHLTANFFLDRGLDCNFLVYKGVWILKYMMASSRLAFFSKAPSQTLAKSKCGPKNGSKLFSSSYVHR